MKHPRTVEGYESFDDLIDEIMDDFSILLFIELLADDLYCQADKDLAGNRTRLASRLYQTSEQLYQAADLWYGEDDKVSREIAEPFHKLISNVGVMQYDCIAEIIEKFSEKFSEDGLKFLGYDQELAFSMIDTAEHLYNAHVEMMEVWEICERYIKT